MKTQTMKYFAMSVFVFVQAVSFGQADSKEQEAVKKVLDRYQKAIERLDIAGTEELFTKNSIVIESGKVEGTYLDYFAHHLGPELGDFMSFKFSDYKADVKVDLPYAFVTETYKYTIVIKKDNSVAERKGVASSVLKKENGVWKIIQTHTSSRRP